MHAPQATVYRAGDAGPLGNSLQSCGCRLSWQQLIEVGLQAPQATVYRAGDAGSLGNSLQRWGCRLPRQQFIELGMHAPQATVLRALDAALQTTIYRDGDAGSLGNSIQSLQAQNILCWLEEAQSCTRQTQGITVGNRSFPGSNHSILQSLKNAGSIDNSFCIELTRVYRAWGMHTPSLLGNSLSRLG